MDLRLLLSTLESVAGVDPAPQLRAPPKPTVSRQHFFDAEGADPLNTPPCLGYRALTPFEVCSLYAQGKFEFLDVPVESDLRSHQHAVPLHARSALRLAQTLTVAANFDYTFSISHLSARDLMMIDAFLRDDIYTHLRDIIAGEAIAPTPASQTYPCIRDLPVLAVIQSLKGLHAATLKLTDFRMHLFTEVDQWQSPAKVIDALQHLATLLYNLDHHRAVLDMYITPQITALPEDIRNFADMLVAHHASPLSIAMFYNAATAELAHAYNLHENLTNRLRRLCCPEFQSSEPGVPNIPLAQSPQNNVWAPATTVQAPSNPSLACSSSTVTTVIQTSHAAALKQSAPADSPLASLSPAPSSLALKPSTPTAVTDPVSEPVSVVSPPSSVDLESRPEDKNPPISKGVPPVKRRFTPPSPASQQQFRKKLAAYAAVLDAEDLEAPLPASTSAEQSTSKPAPQPPSASAPPEGFSGCSFCSGNHFSTGCEVVKSLDTRCRILANAGRCFKCLYLHAPGYCKRASKPCHLCSDKYHHTALCYKNRRQVVTDVAGDFEAFYRRMRDLAEAKYEELYSVPRQ
ncbi:hypothetical protein ANCCEY_01409 [Ancylostoma ceylanicum]|uniref:Uncharacterized protein n=1 Tax=Ancylostoma ceylanicum TaxID=53326 RepID=A0A0D6MCT5_9BILA|nr:hypothetical protein ANCCEY_01409 [Ancylostoma ceylanicum]